MEKKAMMTLKIGNKFRKKSVGLPGLLSFSRYSKRGFSFFEIMTTVAILSFGIVIIFQTFLTSLNSFGYYLTNLQAQCWADEKIWEISDDLIREDFIDNCQINGNLLLANKGVTWIMKIDRIDEEENFFKLALIVCWQEGNRRIEIYRTAYAGI